MYRGKQLRTRSYRSHETERKMQIVRHFLHTIVRETHNDSRVRLRNFEPQKWKFKNKKRK